MVDLTILTYPVNIYGNLKYWYRNHILQRGRYGGHHAVTRSLIEGLDKFGYKNYNYQPFFENDISKNHVHVLAGIDTLAYALSVKDRLKIKNLTAGPNIFMLSSKEINMIYDNRIDKYFHPSSNTMNTYFDYLKNIDISKHDYFPAGVDVDFFKPRYTLSQRLESNNKKVMLYHKYESDDFAQNVKKIIEDHGYEVIYFKYGTYNLNEFKETLENVVLAVVISYYESQGICLQEAWSMDVPTFCYDTSFWYFNDIDYKDYNYASRCPYLTGETGRKWKDLNELAYYLDKYKTDEIVFSPRDYCVKNLSDEICSKNFLYKIGLGN